MPTEPNGHVNPQKIAEAAALVGTPFYLYDEAMIVERCAALKAMPHAFGLDVSYACKANSGRAILQIIAAQGIGLDVSSLNEARRAHLAGIPYDRMMLTTQDVPEGEHRADLERMIQQGLRYNACSLRQLQLIAPFARQRQLELAVRVNPGVGAGESVTRNTGDKYSSFGIHLANLEKVKGIARSEGLVLREVHSHIGSGGDPETWRENIDRMLDITEQHFPDASVVNLGGGFKEARMPDEKAADIQALGNYAKERFEAFHARTGRALRMAVEPGTYVVANAGNLVAELIDRKWSGPDGFDFLILNAGMEANTRPLLYGSRHPFYVVSRSGALLSSEFNLNGPRAADLEHRVVVGRCCESGDSQSLDHHGHIIPRRMGRPEVGDFVVIGGAGAYCSAMSLTNYNSYLAAPEVLLRCDGTLRVIRTQQRLEQIVANEVGLDG
jgi:diaminopimelate decarboxylase